MKRLTLFTLMIISVTIATAGTNKNGQLMQEEKKISTEELKQKITNSRNELLSAGYTQEMMNDLFGDENFYFPTTRDKLNTSFYIIDKLIENKQYKESERGVLLSLAKKAFNAYSRNQLAESMN